MRFSQNVLALLCLLLCLPWVLYTSFSTALQVQVRGALPQYMDAFWRVIARPQPGDEWR
jgi:hypothetical protein